MIKDLLPNLALPIGYLPDEPEPHKVASLNSALLLDTLPEVQNVKEAVIP